MNRREAGTMLLGALTLGASSAAVAQHDRPGGYGGPGGPDGYRPRGPMGPMGEAEQRHAMDTLRLGSMSLMTSELAQNRAQGTGVHRFADFEVAEQTTIAQIIRESTGMAPPPPDPMAQEMMARLQRMRGPDFDNAYVAGQLDAHHRLLDVQDRYLREGRNPDMRHVSMMARTQINEHLRILDDIQRRRGEG